jgi:hypothetical protein
MALTPYPSLATLPEVIANGGKLPGHSIDMFAARTIYASSIPGVKLDCDLDTGLKIGGGTATDNVAAFRAVLATATQANPVELVIDGPSLLGGPLDGPAAGGWSITAGGRKNWKRGFYMANGANGSAIQNFPHTNLAEFNVWNPGGAQSITGSHITLSGFRINGNRVGNCTGATDGTLTGQTATPSNLRGPYALVYWLSGIVLKGIEHFDIEDVWVYDAPAYGINLYHCTDGEINNCRLEVADPTVLGNQDGVHFNGGCRRITTRGGYFRTGDDPWAANVAEGDGTGGSDLVWEGATLDNALNFGRVHAKGATGPLDRVTVRNIKGTVQNAGFNLGLENGAADPNPEIVRSLSISDCEIALTTSNFRNSFLWINGNAGNVVLDNCRWISPGQAAPFVLVGTTGSTVSSLKVLDCGIHRTEAAHAAAYALEGSVASTKITDLVISGFRVTEQDGHSYADIPALVNLAGTTVGKLSLDASVKGVGKVLNITSASAVGSVEVSLDHTSHAGSPTSNSIVAATSSGAIPVMVKQYKGTNVVGPASGAVTLTGPGLVSSGFSFADAMIANNSTYNSSDQGTLCWKSGGVAIPLGVVPAATAYTLTGPSSGVTGAASGNFTVTPNGTYTGNITITPSGGGLSTPIVKTFSGTSAPQNFTITPTADATVTLTPTASPTLGTNPSALSYVASSAIMEDNFAGTAGTSLTGRTPDTTTDGSTTWGAPEAAEGGMVIKAGGGAITTAASPSGNTYANPSGSADSPVTFVWTNPNTSAVPTMQIRSDGVAATNYLQFDANYGLNEIHISKMVAGAFTGNIAIFALSSVGLTFTINTAYTLALTPSGTTLTGTINGQSIGSITIPASAFKGIAIRQQAGSAGDTVFTKAKVTS